MKAIQTWERDCERSLARSRRQRAEQPVRGPRARRGVEVALVALVLIGAAVAVMLVLDMLPWSP